MIEQLRLQEGRLFQNEKTLALYLDVKAVVYEALVAAARSEDREESHKALLAFDEESDNKIIGAFLQLAPTGMREYHAKSLHDCVKIVANLLWPTEILLVARPKVSSLLSGVLRRMASQSIVSTGNFLELDPIKQDFLIREAFRRCLVNDCLVVFEPKDETSGAETYAAESKEIDLEGEVGPDDSASHVGFDERPSGARSVVGSRSVLPTLEEEVKQDRSVVGARSVVARSVTGRSEVGRSNESEKVSAKTGSVVAGSAVAGSVVAVSAVAGSMKAGSVIQSVAPRVITVSGDGASVASKASGTTATSIMRRALNVRKVHIEPDV